MPAPNIAINLTRLNEEIPDHVGLVAVSKTKSADMILEAYNAGHRMFGENRAQELATKFEELPKDIIWHFIGHLQSKKVKYISGFVNLIHAVDSLKLLQVINKEALKHNRTIDCLLQIHIAKEENKYGFSPEEITNLIDSDELTELKNIRIKGLMGMATFTEDNSIIESEFLGLKKMFDKVKSLKNERFEPTILSMGMSGDYKIAVEMGSNLIRVGSLIFGERT
ncbi:MAG: YggS family pyridoxal phosphate-dependent enzyme [Bacteroidetes bacterium]|nr:MAG: YggS family pyridoxal phosphate-dependent enzyme [Bacteroidota bacterium]